MTNQTFDPGETSVDSEKGRLQERERLLNYYWRKGIPSLVLAFVTIVLAVYSHFFVQPNIKQRYRDIVSANFQLLGEKPGELASRSVGDEGFKSELDADVGIETELPSMASALRSERETQSDVHGRATAERLNVLEQTQLCLRRLIIWDKTDDSVRFQSGQILDLLGDWYLDSARSRTRNVAVSDETGALIGKASAQRQKALEAMRAAQKLNGPFADNASLWLARRKLFDNHELPTSELDSLSDQVAKIVEKQSSSAVAPSANASTVASSGNQTAAAFSRQLLGEIRVLQASSCRTERSNSERRALLQEAVKLLSLDQNAETEMLSWAAEASVALDGDAARETANKALQSYWGSRNKEMLPPERLAVVFRCLLLINSTKEAQLFLSEQLQQISAIDQPRFRSLSSAAALRHLVLTVIRDSKNGDGLVAQRGVALNLLAAFSTAVQLQPESSELLSLLERFAKGNEDELLVSLKSSMGLVGTVNTGGKAGTADGTRNGPVNLDVSVKSFLSAIAALGAGELDKPSEDALVISLKASPAFGVAGSRLAIRMNGSGVVSSELAIRWLKSINEAVPEVLVAWSDRASLSMKEKKFQAAIECLEYLLERLPDNAQVVEMLDAAKAQLKVSE